MNFILDTNVLIHYIRMDKFAEKLDVTFRPFAAGNRPVVPIVVFGEVKSIAMQNGWGAKKLALLDELLLKVLRADITLEIVERYAEIDAYSQGKLDFSASDEIRITSDEPISGEFTLSDKYSGFTSRNMGKNDLWIAATASVLKTKLLTADADFDHLDAVFLEVERVIV